MLFKSRLINCSLIVLIAVVSFMGCSSDDSDEVFTSETSTKLDNSIISLPASLSAQQSSSSRNIRAIRSNSGGMAGIYSGITAYIGVAEMFKDLVKEFMTEIIGNGILQSVPLGEEFIIPTDSSDPDAPKKVKVEKPDAAGNGEDYVWKISLYFSAEATDPDMIVRFTLEGDGAKGRMLWEITEEDEDLTDAGITDVNITRSIDVAFDGTTSTKTLEIKLIQDLSEYNTYAQSNWNSLTSDQQEALDLGQPAKVFLNATYNGTEFTIYGTSYHPGWATEATLEGDDSMWGDDNRNMYMFKTKAIEGTTEGAKLYLALPLATTSDTTNVWTEDSVSEVFTDMMLAQLNTLIGRYHDDTDDADLDGDMAAEQAVADIFVYYIRGTAPTQESHYTITEAELESFINDPNPPSGSEDLISAYNSVKYMINPAFYDSTNGFLGTYDDDSTSANYGTFYNYNSTAGTMTAGTAPASFEILNALDLSTINPYVPTEVVAATITVE